MSDNATYEKEEIYKISISSNLRIVFAAASLPALYVISLTIYKLTGINTLAIATLIAVLPFVYIALTVVCTERYIEYYERTGVGFVKGGDARWALMARFVIKERVRG